MKRVRANEYNIMDKIYDNDYLLVFDIDGVLSKYQYGEYRANACSDEDWDTYIKYTDLYCNAKSSKVFEELISECDYRCYVLSVANTQSEREQKIHFIDCNYDILIGHIYFCNNKIEKPSYLETIEKYHKRISPNFKDDGKHIIMIDDSVDVLSLIEQKTNYLTCHVSSFLE